MQTLRRFDHKGVHQIQTWSLMSHPLLHIMANTPSIAMHTYQLPYRQNCYTVKRSLWLSALSLAHHRHANSLNNWSSSIQVAHYFIASGRDCWRIVRQIEIIDIITSFCVFVWCPNTPACQFTCRGHHTNYPIHGMECLTCTAQHRYDSGFAPATCTHTTTTN